MNERLCLETPDSHKELYDGLDYQVSKEFEAVSICSNVNDLSDKTALQTLLQIAPPDFVPMELTPAKGVELQRYSFPSEELNTRKKTRAEAELEYSGRSQGNDFEHPKLAKYYGSLGRIIQLSIKASQPNSPAATAAASASPITGKSPQKVKTPKFSDKLVSLAQRTLLPAAADDQAKKNEEALIEDRKALCKRFFKLMNIGNMVGLAKLISDTCSEACHLVSPDLSEDITGKLEVMMLFSLLYEAYPDGIWTVTNISTRGDTITYHYRFTGTGVVDFPLNTLFLLIRQHSQRYLNADNAEMSVDAIQQQQIVNTVAEYCHPPAATAAASLGAFSESPMLHSQHASPDTLNSLKYVEQYSQQQQYQYQQQPQFQYQQQQQQPQYQYQQQQQYQHQMGFVSSSGKHTSSSVVCSGDFGRSSSPDSTAEESQFLTSRSDSGSFKSQQGNQQLLSPSQMLLSSNSGSIKATTTGIAGIAVGKMNSAVSPLSRVQSTEEYQMQMILAMNDLNSTVRSAGSTPRSSAVGSSNNNNINRINNGSSESSSSSSISGVFQSQRKKTVYGQSLRDIAASVGDLQRPQQIISLEASSVDSVDSNYNNSYAATAAGIAVQSYGSPAAAIGADDGFIRIPRRKESLCEMGIIENNVLMNGPITHRRVIAFKFDSDNHIEQIHMTNQ